MKRIAFYVNNSQFPDIDCSKPELGNPGIGGSEHLIILIASELSKRDNKLDIILYIQEHGRFQKSLNTEFAHNAEEAIFLADFNNIDIFIVDQKNINWSKFDFQRLKGKIKIVPWCHNTPSIQDLYLWSNNDKIGRIITVSREELDLFRDHPIFRKSDYIFNCVPINKNSIVEAQECQYSKRGNNVVYMGSLTPIKSFHILAEIWRDILSEIPDAKLYIIGSGRLYCKKNILGKYGIAEEEYEKRFIPFITDEEGKIIPSIIFCGNMGVEKYEILKRCKVGVPNPTGLSETFCLSSVEMQSMGVTVTAMDTPCYHDTFINGIIVPQNKEFLKSSIIYLLKSHETLKPYTQTINTINTLFSIDAVCSKWEKLLNSKLNKHINRIYPLHNYKYKKKWQKDAVRLIITIFPFLKIKTIAEEPSFRNRLAIRSRIRKFVSKHKNKLPECFFRHN